MTIFLRTNIETVFKTDKEYLKLLPLCKWSDIAVRGKIFTDIVNSIIRKNMYEYVKNSYPLTWGPKPHVHYAWLRGSVTVKSGLLSATAVGGFHSWLGRSLHPSLARATAVQADLPTKPC